MECVSYGMCFIYLFSWFIFPFPFFFHLSVHHIHVFLLCLFFHLPILSSTIAIHCEFSKENAYDNFFTRWKIQPYDHVVLKIVQVYVMRCLQFRTNTHTHTYNMQAQFNKIYMILCTNTRPFHQMASHVKSGRPKAILEAFQRHKQQESISACLRLYNSVRN